MSLTSPVHLTPSDNASRPYTSSSVDKIRSMTDLLQIIGNTDATIITSMHHFTHGAENSHNPYSPG
eukprot:11965-Eustigmatos_ZCMA.PRE.1